MARPLKKVTSSQLLLLQEKCQQQKGEIARLQLKQQRWQGLFEFGQFLSLLAFEKNIDAKSLNRAGKLLAQLLNCGAVRILRYEVKKDVFSAPAYGGRPAYQQEQHATNSLVVTCGKSRQTRVLGTSQIRSEFAILKELKDIFHLKARNALLTPLVVGPQLLGVLVAIDGEEGEFKGDEQQMIKVLAQQLASTLHNHILFSTLQNNLFQVCQAFAASIGKKDHYTGGHTKRVGIFAQMIAQELSLSPQEIFELKLAGVLHDIGKIGISDKILKKRAPLTEAEFEIMKNHPRYGYEILGHIDGMERVIDGMRYHHEREDGKGYPYGLKGSEVPRLAQIISVADTFDAMIGHRPYRKGLPPMDAYREILRNRGTQFNPEVVDAFVRAFRKSRMFKKDQKK